MAVPKENSLSLGHLTGMERHTFTKRREHSGRKSVNKPVLQVDFSTPQSHQHLRKMHLQRRLQELEEREVAAQRRNRQLLQQFEDAQDTLREMMTLTANMKTIRMEYERYLEESAPRWQRQLMEQTQAAQKKRMEEFLKSCLKNTDERVVKSSADRSFLSPGSQTKPQNPAAPQTHYSQNNHLDYYHDGSPHLPNMQTLPQLQASRFPIRAPSHVPPSYLPPPIFSHLFPLPSMPVNQQPWPRQAPPGWTSPQPDWSWTAGLPAGSEALWGRLYTEEPPPEREVVQAAGEEAEINRAPSSKRERGGGGRSSHLSQELDEKPVRLSGSPAESSESSRASSQTSREKRRGRSQRSSSDKERCSSQASSQSSSAIITAAATARAKSSDSDASSEKRLKNDEHHEQQTASSEDEEVDEEEEEEEEEESEGGEDKVEEIAESDEEEEEEQGDEAAGEPEGERDSEDSIISPQNIPKKIHIIPEEASEDEDDQQEEEEEGSNDEDIENLLAPQEQSQKEEKSAEAEEKPKENCDKVQIFQVRTKTDHLSDSEGFDDFYD